MQPNDCTPATCPGEAEYSARSGESEKIDVSRLVGIAANNYNWCHECASTTTEPPVPDDVEDLPARGNTLTRCSFCGRKLSEVPG